MGDCEEPMDQGRDLFMMTEFEPNEQVSSAELRHNVFMRILACRRRLGEMKSLLITILLFLILTILVLCLLVRLGNLASTMDALIFDVKEQESNVQDQTLSLMESVSQLRGQLTALEAAMDTIQDNLTVSTAQGHEDVQSRFSGWAANIQNLIGSLDNRIENLTDSYWNSRITNLTDSFDDNLANLTTSMDSHMRNFSGDLNEKIQNLQNNVATSFDWERQLWRNETEVLKSIVRTLQEHGANLTKELKMISSPWQVNLYEHSDFQGKALTLKGSTRESFRCVNLANFDNSASSITFNICVIIYDSPGCGGNQKNFRPEGVNECETNFSLCGFNDIASSVGPC